MGSRFEVRGWTWGTNPERLGIPGGEDEGWYYAELYRGESLLRALWTALTARRHYGCVKLELR